MRTRLWILVAGLVVAGVLVGFFVTRFLNPTPPTIAATSTSTVLQGRPVVNFTLTTVAAVGDAGQGHGEHPNWVGYLPTTYLSVPAGAVVHMTIDQQDGSSGLRNAYFSLVRGTVNNEMTVNGKVMKALDPDNPGPGHTFTIPDLGISVPLEGVADDAPEGAQNVVQFDFVVPDKKGTFRWQCFVPCAAGTVYGNGGPMQTLGYMAGELQVG
jgi:xanthosine utilization system XapX-like protein